MKEITLFKRWLSRIGNFVGILTPKMSKTTFGENFFEVAVRVTDDPDGRMSGAASPAGDSILCPPRTSSGRPEL